MKHSHLKRTTASAAAHRQMQRGASLIMVMLILIVVSLIGVGGIQISMMAERGSRSDRDMQIAWQSAEAGLIDAENDILGPGSSSRRSVFTRGQTDLTAFMAGCGNSGNSVGLCSYVTSGSKPAWVTVDLTGSNAAAVGQFTGRSFQIGSTGIVPAAKPRYVIEPIPEEQDARVKGPTATSYVYRVTAIGFGPNADTQAVVQMIYRN